MKTDTECSVWTRFAPTRRAEHPIRNHLYSQSYGRKGHRNERWVMRDYEHQCSNGRNGDTNPAHDLHLGQRRVQPRRAKGDRKRRRQPPGVGCRVGAGLAPDAPHGPVREYSLIRFVSDDPFGPKTLQVTTPQGVMTVAAHQNTCVIRGRGSARCCSTCATNLSQLIRFVEFLRPSHFRHVSRVCS